MSKRKKQKLWASLSFFIVLLIIAGVFIGVKVSEKKNVPSKSKVTNADELIGAKIGVQIGTTGDIYVSDYEGQDGTVVEKYNKGADAIMALKQEKVDCVVIDELPALEFIKKNSDLSILDQEFALEDYAICVAKDNDVLTGQINNALAELFSKGIIDEINDYYLNNENGDLPRYTSPENVDRSKGTFTVATNAAFPPYEYYENNEIKGIDMDMAQALADEMGMELSVVDMEFDSIITAVSSHKADAGMAGMTVTEDRLKNINFSDSYTTSKQVIVVRNGTVAKGQSFASKFKQNFITQNRWKYLFTGFGNTIIITILAIIIGIVLGFIIAIVRVCHDLNGSLGLWNAVCKVYLTIIRGTPAVIQLLIIYYVIFASVNINKVLVATIAFGLNSAAYVAEVIRSGIMSTDKGQFEAGRSLGLSFGQTMRSIILPQAIKSTLPALGNEFIALLKETSISGYIGLKDLTKGGDIIRSTTWEAFMPYMAVALLYLIVVMILETGVNHLERRLKKNER